jgi:2'-5' RNA ligase
MAYAITLLFDPETEKLLAQFKKLFDGARIPDTEQRRIRPHITLCIFEEIACADCECRISEIASDFSLSTLMLDHLGIFHQQDNVLFIAPTPNPQLLALQKRVFEDISAFATLPWKMYQPGTWVPHCTLANGLRDVELVRAVALSLQIDLPIEARIDEIGIIQFDPVQPIFEVKVKKEDNSDP